jgi:hypothetical protein
MKRYGIYAGICLIGAIFSALNVLVLATLCFIGAGYWLGVTRNE